MKVLIVKGCADCSWCRPNISGNSGWACRKFGIVGAGKDLPPVTPHPNCKLNDLPDVEKMAETVWTYDNNKEVQQGFLDGAATVIREITR